MDRRAVQLLRSARDLVRRGWTQHAEGRDAHGAAVEPWHPTATSWSLLGALVAALEVQTDGGKELPLVQLADELKERFRIGHVTIQIEVNEEIACALEPDNVV